MTVTYKDLIAQGVPPEVAAQTIYNNLQESKRDLQGDDQQNHPPQKKESPKVTLPEMEMLEPADEEDEPTRGRPRDPFSMERVLSSVLLAQSYAIAGNSKVLTQKELKGLVGQVYGHYEREFEFPAGSTLTNLMSRLRNGRIEGFPKMMLKGPYEQTWDGQRQVVVRVYHRDKKADIARNAIDPKLVPRWVFQ